MRWKKSYPNLVKIGLVKKDYEYLSIGQTQAGRYLRVVYVPDPEPNSVFAITAYDLRGKALLAYKRRRRRRKG